LSFLYFRNWFVWKFRELKHRIHLEYGTLCFCVNEVLLSILIKEMQNKCAISLSSLASFYRNTGCYRSKAIFRYFKTDLSMYTCLLVHFCAFGSIYVRGFCSLLHCLVLTIWFRYQFFLPRLTYSQFVILFLYLQITVNHISLSRRPLLWN
jgi:hypothetical protein